MGVGGELLVLFNGVGHGDGLSLRHTAELLRKDRDPASTLATAGRGVRLPLTGGHMAFVTPGVTDGDGGAGGAGPLPVSFLGTTHQQNGPPWYRSNSLPPALRRFRWMSSSRVFIRRRGSARSPSPATGRTRTSRPRRRRSSRWKDSPAESGRRRRRTVQEALRQEGRNQGRDLPRRRLRRRQDPPAGLAVARRPRAPRPSARSWNTPTWWARCPSARRSRR